MGSYGLEPTPEMYVEHTIEILRAIRRVLRKDGVVFWNIGDSYATSSPGTSEMEPVTWSESGQPKKMGMTRTGRVPGLKPKDICLIPFRVAIAAQEDGWWVRSVIIWSKPNPMPESADDRPTRSYEYILMFTKSADYYWDADAVREITKPWGADGFRHGNVYTDNKAFYPDADIQTHPDRDEIMSGRNIRSVWEFPTEASGLEMCLKCKTVYESAVYQRLPSKVIGRGQPGRMGRGGNDPELSNRNFMPIKEARDRPLESPIHPYRGDGWGEQAIEGRDTPLRVKVCRCGASDWLSHFAVFPEKLPEICIKAATPEVGCCSMCGAPYERVTKVIGKQVTESMRIAGCDSKGEYKGQDLTDYSQAMAQSPSDTKRRILSSMGQIKELSWQPTCKCNADKVPSLVLDPLAGSGRVGKVAKDLGRKAILIDTSEDYCRLAKRRIEVVPLPMIFPTEETYPEAPDWF